MAGRKFKLQPEDEGIAGGYDPYNALGVTEEDVRSLGPPQPERLLGGRGGGMSTGSAAKAAKQLSKAKESPFTLPREPRSTPKGDRPKAKAKAGIGHNNPPPEFKLNIPAIQSKGYGPAIEKIYQHAAEERTPKYPVAKEPVFGKADADLTRALVKQDPLTADVPPMPPGKFPLGQRGQQIWEARNEIGSQLANDLLTAGIPMKDFYATGSVHQGLTDKAGLSPPEATDFMRGWAGEGAATSPRTKTPSNLRNASYLQFRRASGDPLTEEKWGSEVYGANEKGEPLHNRPGFAMIGGMHPALAEGMATGTVDPWSNTKPYMFRDAWAGNLKPLVADTHEIRGVLDTFDQIYPGQLQREWFPTGAEGEQAFRDYQEAKGFPKTGALPGLRDSLATQMVGGREAQTEYPILSAPAQIAAERLGIDPSEAQSSMWFHKGPRTGLKSPPMTIPDLFNAQIEKTAKVLGMHPEQVLKLWAKKFIPLAEADDMNVPGASAVG